MQTACMNALRHRPRCTDDSVLAVECTGVVLFVCCWRSGMRRALLTPRAVAMVVVVVAATVMAVAAVAIASRAAAPPVAVDFFVMSRCPDAQVHSAADLPESVGID